MAVLSVQSDVAVGMVGNRAASFALQRMGIETWPVDTVRFSNHPGHGEFRGEVASLEEIAAQLEGIEAHTQFRDCNALLSGYLGQADIGELVLQSCARLKSANPHALYACDPVIGDDGKIYVRAGIEEFFRDRAISQADILTPNHFEFSRLIGENAATLASVKIAAQNLRQKMQGGGPRIVLISGLITNETPADSIDLFVVGPDGTALCRTPRFDRHFSGAGDLLAAVFLAQILARHPPATAMARAASAVYAVLNATNAAHKTELDLIAAQGNLLNPSQSFVSVTL